MKPFPTILILAGFLCHSASAMPPAQGRRLQDLNVISTRVLQRSISPKFYKSLCISPIQGWVVVRANIVNTRLGGPRIVHSELDGAYDELALKLAKEALITGYYGIERPGIGGSVLLHLLIYQIADGTMVLSFPTFDEPGGNQMQYWGCSRLLVLKEDGKWTEIEGPEGLHGKGWRVITAGLPPPPGAKGDPVGGPKKKAK
ncbi:MAG TPA: hypothetical protein VEX43_16905 [Chthoniobacterales bacterium]|nr:hypothetical protein [Chthoniobacterales bacterium]